ncbi:MAG: helix-turn-helix transcriptional regulator [Deltaproteobacteria bacterium]|nr:helix-turn-helix transcriptional regulator [Deltaproteobacteria bacterium]
MSVPAAQRRRLVTAATNQVEDLAEIFKNLADASRLRILTTLVEAREMCVHEICAKVKMSQPAVSHQLRVLRNARLVRTRRAGREIFYSLDDDHVLGLLSEGLRHTGHLGPRKGNGR